MTMHQSASGRCAILAAVSMTILACGASEDSPELRESGQPVVSRKEADLPELGDFPLAVCFNPNSDGSSAQKAAVQARAETAWVGLARSAISFSGWATCPEDAGAEFIKIYLHSSVERGLYSWVSRNMRLPVGTSNWHVATTVHEFGHALGIRHEQAHPDTPESCTADQNTLADDDLVLTTYDPDAVMNYCAGDSATVSAREELFAEMAFPSDADDHLLRADAAYETSQGLLVRSDALLQTDWTRRGALSAAFEGVSWSVGASTFQSVTLPLTDLGTLITVDHAFVDFRGVAHTALGRTVEVSDAKHAGLTMAVATGFL